MAGSMLPVAYPEVVGNYFEILNPPVARVAPHSVQDLRCVCHLCIYGTAGGTEDQTITPAARAALQ
jgi:hypothetical protein